MNMQKMIQEAQRLQKEIEKKQKELENTEYSGESSLVKVTINGKKELLNVKININESIAQDEIEMVEDMILVAVNSAVKKAEEDKKIKLDKYGQGISGLI